MKQLRTWTQRVIANEVTARYILEARASQVILLHGFRITLHQGLQTDFAAAGDAIDLHGLIQARPRALVTEQGADTTALDAFLRDRATLGWVHARTAIRASVTEAVALVAGNPAPGWTPCDFEVPGLWMVAWSVSINNVTISTFQVELLFDWVTRTPMQVAALYTSYGFDPVDATEKPAVSDRIDFTQGMGTGPLPALIG